MKILIKNAKAIITMNDNNDVLFNHNLLIQDNKIEYIGKELKEADKIIDAKDMYIYPGLINTHHHLYQTFTRNLPEVQNMELFPWLKYLYEIWKHLDDEVIYLSSLVGMGELVKYGCTTVFDHHYVFRSDTECDFISVQMKAAKDLGVRFHASRGSMSLGVDDGGLPPMSVVESLEEIIKDSERLIKIFHDTSKYSMNQIVLAPCSPFSVSDELMVESAKLARKYGVKLHTHLGETLDEEDYCLETSKERPLAYMERLGWIGEDVFFAHGIHFNDEELKRLSDTKTGVAHCPVSNQKLSSGIARISEMVKLNIPVGLAVDGSASNDGSNLLAELRAGYLLQRLRYSNDAITPEGMLRIATRGGAKILGRKDIGYLEKGMAADMFVLDTTRLQYVGTNKDPIALLATVGVNHPVDYTIINGKIIVQDGEIKTIDENKIVKEANIKFEEFINM
ncbi:MAG: 8-oxoguanine deaminase [Candidatus Izimaplasma bacterium HR2]|nr:MAG: 8-oxoguanine deaminase [Candidatus Izimaplasma bacterium HR2]